MNLQCGARKGLSHSSAPTTYITLPKPSSKVLMLMWHLVKHSARGQDTMSPPAVLSHESGHLTLQIARRTRTTLADTRDPSMLVSPVRILIRWCRVSRLLASLQQCQSVPSHPCPRPGIGNLHLRSSLIMGVLFSRNCTLYGLYDSSWDRSS